MDDGQRLPPGFTYINTIWSFNSWSAYERTAKEYKNGRLPTQAEVRSIPQNLRDGPIDIWVPTIDGGGFIELRTSRNPEVCAYLSLGKPHSALPSLGCIFCLPSGLSPWFCCCLCPCASPHHRSLNHCTLCPCICWRKALIVVDGAELKLNPPAEEKMELDVIAHQTSVFFVKLELENAALSLQTLASLVHPQLLPRELLLYQLLQGDPLKETCPHCSTAPISIDNDLEKDQLVDDVVVTDGIKPRLLSGHSALSFSRLMNNSWLFQHQTGWVSFDPETTETLEECYSTNPDTIIQFQTPESEVLIDLKTMTQTNIFTGQQSKIKRFAPDISIPGMSSRSSSQEEVRKEITPRILSIIRGSSLRVLPNPTNTDESVTWIFTDGKTDWKIIDKKSIGPLEDQYAQYVKDLDPKLSRVQLKDLLVDFRSMTARSPDSKQYKLQRLGKDIHQVKTEGQRNKLRRELLSKLTPTDGVHAVVAFSSDDATRDVKDDLIETNQLLRDSSVLCPVCYGTRQVSHHLTIEQAKAASSDHFDDTECQVCWGDGSFKMSTRCNHFYCGDCIRGTLEACLELGKFPVRCPSCQAADLESSNEAIKAGEVTEKCLRYLQQRGIISRTFYYRFTKAMNRDAKSAAAEVMMEEADEKKQRGKGNGEQDWFTCPGKCGAFLLKEHPSYSEQGLGLFCEFNDQVAVRLGQCPQCQILLCPRCDRTEKDTKTRHECPKAAAKDDPATLKLLQTLGKKCPACGNVVQKNEGCDLMMCGTNAHGKVADALRNGGCAYIFSWNTLKPVRDGHGYIDIHGNRVKGQFGPSNGRQKLL